MDASNPFRNKPNFTVRALVYNILVIIIGTTRNLPSELFAKIVKRFLFSHVMRVAIDDQEFQHSFFNKRKFTHYSWTNTLLE